MSDILSIDAAREHLRVGDEISDAAIEALIDAAETVVADFLGRPLIDEDLGWPTVEELPASVVHSIKLIATWLNDDRADLLIEMGAIRALIGRYMVTSVA